MPIYVQVDGIQGEAKEANHSNWIDATSFSSPVVRSVPNGLYGNDAIHGGALVFGNVVLGRKLDSSSIPLAKNTALGTVYPGGIKIDVTTPLGNGEKVLVQYKLTNAILASHSIDASTTTGGPQSLTEHVEINFSKIEWTYNKYNADGSANGSINGWYDRQIAQGG